MKILHVLRAPVGGLFRHVVDLAHGQIERGHEVGLIVDSGKTNGLSEQTLAALAPKLALGLSRFRIFRQPGPADFAAVWHVASRIHATGAEIVHGHGAKGGALARLAPAPHVLVRAYTPHGGSLHDAVAGRICILMERALKHRGQLYLFESAYSYDVYRRKVGQPPGAVRVVHNGVRKDECEPVALAADASDFVYLGEMRALKGVDVLIDALARLNYNGRRVSATLIGNGPDAVLFRARAAALGLADLVTFREPMAARQALAHGRIMVVPSRAESLPYVVLEAAAAGKPLVATKVGGIPEVMGPLANRLVAPDDVGALADAIVNALDEPAAMAAAANALRMRVQTAFSVDVMVDAVVAAYHQARTLVREEARRAEPAIKQQLTVR
jgi:glycosyltransferase involved in cell wall biosynthesis